MTALVFVSVLGLCFVAGDAAHVLKEEKDEENALAPNSERFLLRRLTTVFYDDFSSGHVDPSKWKIEISASAYAHQFQMYTPEPVNVYVKGGVLFLRPTLTVDTFGNDFLVNGTVDAKAIWGACTFYDCHRSGVNEVRPTMSGRVISKAHVRYGRVEVDARVAKGDWLWSAIWMMPQDSAYGGWPKSGEIDILEAAGNEHLTFRTGASAGIDMEHATVHYGPVADGHKSHGNVYHIPGTTFANDFHKYWLEWTENYIKIGVDDHTTLVLNTPASGFWTEGGFHGQNIWSQGGRNAPFDKPFYLIMNVAVGGNGFWSGYVNHPYSRPWSDNSTTLMMDFWNARHLWYPTWHGEDVAMKIRSVKMLQY